MEPDVPGSDPSILGPAGRFVLSLNEPPTGGLDAGITEAMGPGGWDAYRSNVTSELLRVDDDDFAVSRYSIGPVDGADDVVTEATALLGVSANGSDVVSAPGSVATARELSLASSAPSSPDIERAAISHVQPAALTLLGVCLALALAGGREWRRRNWHRRYMRRRR